MSSLSRLAFLAIAALFLFIPNEAQRTKLRDVSALTLREGAMTTGRRSSPLPQLKCVGGTAGCRGNVKLPRTVQCSNSGHDGVDVQWECRAEMDDRVQFGQISVTCEGYSHPEDEYILAGSCGLEYELDWRSGGSSGTRYPTKQSSLGSWVEWIGNVLVILFIAGVILYMCYNAGGGDGGAAGPRHGGFFGGGFDGGPGGGGPGYGPPPSYHDATGRKPYGFAGAPPPAAGGGAGAEGPGFWTGLGLGGLGGYFMGRQNGDGANNRWRSAGAARPDEFHRAAGFDDFHDQPSTSSGVRESTAFGGTRRR